MCVSVTLHPTHCTHHCIQNVAPPAANNARTRSNGTAAALEEKTSSLFMLRFYMYITDADMVHGQYRSNRIGRRRRYDATLTGVSGGLSLQYSHVALASYMA